MQSNDAADIEARKARFLRELKAHNLLMDCMTEVLENYEQTIKLRDNQPERDLDLLVAAMHGKGGKTYQAILQLCCSDFGEDALVLLRSNVNLMINLDCAPCTGEFLPRFESGATGCFGFLNPHLVFLRR